MDEKQVKVIGQDSAGREVTISVTKDSGDISAAIAKARKKGAVGRLDLLIIEPEGKNASRVPGIQ